MVSPRAGRLVLASILVAPLACHAIAGVEDKQLDPKHGIGGAAGAGGGIDSGPEAGDAGPEVARPPKRPAGWQGPSGKGVRRHFAARRVFIGSIDPKSPPGQPEKNEDAWRAIGHDLDGKCTTVQQSFADTSGVCKKPSGAPDESLEDGELCRDNAGGRLIAFGLQVLSKDFELNVHNKMQAGQSATFLLEISDLDEGPDDAYAPGALYVTAPVPTPPLWNGSDELPLDQATVDFGSADGAAPEGGLPDASTPDGEGGTTPPSFTARYSFPDAYVANHTWVSGDFNQRAMKLPLFVFDRIAEIDLEALNLDVELEPSHDAVVRSALSAVVAEATLLSQFEPIAREMVSCNDVATALLMYQYLLPAMDLANAPTEFVSADAKCSAISMGFAFDWVAVKEPALVVTVPPAPSQCGDGGS